LIVFNLLLKVIRRDQILLTMPTVILPVESNNEREELLEEGGGAE
jgi:hypothetical protein